MGTDVDDEMRGRVFALLQSLIRVVLILALAAVPFVVAQVGRRTFHVGSVSTSRSTAPGSCWSPGGAARDRCRRAGLPQDGRPAAGRPSGPTSRRRCAATRPRAGGCATAACSSRSRVARASGKSTQIQLLAAALRDDGPASSWSPTNRARPRSAAGSATCCCTATSRCRRAPRRCCSPPTGRITSTPSSGPALDAGRGRADRPLRRLVAGLSGRGPRADVRRGPAAVAVGDAGPHARPDRPARHARRGSGSPGRAAATAARADKLERESLRVPRAGAAGVPRTWPRPSPRRYLVLDATAPATRSPPTCSRRSTRSWPRSGPLLAARRVVLD